MFRVFRLAISIQILFLALLASLATTAGWRLADFVLLSTDSASQPRVEQFLNQVTRWPGQVNGGLTQSETLDTHPLPSQAPGVIFGDASNELNPSGVSSVARMLPEFETEPIHQMIMGTPVYALVEPFRRLFWQSVSWDEFFFYVIGGLWTLLVWALIGGAITRIAAVQLGREERVGVRDALLFARSKWASLIGAPLLPLVAIGILSLPLMFAGVVMRLDLGVLLMGILWPLVILIGLVMSLFGIGLIAGWPLMWATISTEGTDSFDAISRSYGYTYQKPVRYAIYALLSTILGLLGWLVFALFFDTVIGFVDGSVGFGAGGERLESMRLVISSTGEDQAPMMLTWGATLIGLVTSTFQSLLTAYGYGFFWVAAAGIYLLLRLDVDQTEFDDVYLDDDEDMMYGLPTIAQDEAGVPGVTDVDESQSDVERSGE